jgi:Ribosomal silencing factor during starvation
MSMSRALGATCKCQRSHYAALNSFISLAGVSLATITPRSRFPLLASARSSYSIAIGGQRCLSFSASKRIPEPVSGNRSLENEKEEDNAIREDDTQPWYMQIQEAIEPETTLFERQRLPDIPSDCPERLSEIAQYLSEGIGMESITLLDLRSLDPPPALGSNLVMLVSTARSIRHLNVSADRLCRWLRANYKLRAHADGLLGRRELKLKLRRKARRAKILGSKARHTESDDGITTGWICVNIGSVGSSNRGDSLFRSDSGDVVGFGQEGRGVHVVVQMMTEEKRASLQLEELWTSFLNRQAERETKLNERNEASFEALEEGGLDESAASEIAPQQHLSSTTLNSSNSPSFGQRRGLHTSGQPSAASQFSNKPLSQAKDLTNKRAQFEDTRPVSSSDRSGHEMWKKLQDLLTLDQSEAQVALGAGWQDRSSTPFLTSFYDSMSLPPTTNEHRAWLALMQYGKQIQHQGYPIVGMLHVLQQMQEHCAAIPEDIFDKVLKHLAQPGDFKSSEDSSNQQGYEVLSTILSILDDMHLRGHSIRSQTIIEALFRTVATMQRNNPSAAAKHLHPQITAQLERLAHDHRCQVPSSETYFTAIDELAAAHRWDDLWKLWTGFPIRMEARSPELYTAVLRSIAREKHQRACIDAITRLVPTMQLENPPVAVEGETAGALMECLKVADPQVEAQWLNGGHAHRRYVKMFQTCINGLRDRDWWDEEQYTL